MDLGDEESCFIFFLHSKKDCYSQCYEYWTSLTIPRTLFLLLHDFKKNLDSRSRWKKNWRDTRNYIQERVERKNRKLWSPFLAPDLTFLFRHSSQKRAALFCTGPLIRISFFPLFPSILLQFMSCHIFPSFLFFFRLEYRLSPGRET